MTKAKRKRLTRFQRIKRRMRMFFQGQNEILVLGDSHARVFKEDEAHIPGYYFSVVDAGGATISGLKNPNSNSRALHQFKKALRWYFGDICLVTLGEVDTGFVIWYRAKRHGLEVEEIFEQTVSNYIDFIKSIPSKKHVIILSAPLPTIRDDQDWGEVAGLRKEVDAPLVERTNLTVALNSRMQAFAQQYGIYCINLDAASLDENNTVKQELLNADPNDHHYDARAHLKLIMPELTKFVKMIESVQGPRRG
jgi:hypothetical protein